MNITKVLGSRVLVRVIVDAVVPETDSGIVVAPTSINPSYFKGEVLMVGPLTTASTILDNGEQIDGVKVGQTVAFLKYGYEDMGDGLYLVEENSLLAIYE